MTVKNTIFKITRIHKYLPKWLMWMGLAILTTIAILVADRVELFHHLERLISQAENSYQKWGDRQLLTNPWFLLPFAAGGGFLASISPCILALLPVNLSYIGTLNVKSRRAAFLNASGFVLGVVTVLSIFGLFSSVAAAVMVDWRGYY